MAWSDTRLKIAGWIAPKAAGSMSTSTHGILDSIMQRQAPRRGTWELFEAYKNSPWLRAVTTKIAEHIAAVEWTLHKPTRAGRGVRLSTVLGGAKHAGRQKSIKRFKDAGGQLTEVFDHPILDLLTNKPNPYMSGLSMRRLSQTYMELVGEQFYLKEFRKNGDIGEIWPVPTHWVQSVPTANIPTYQLSFFGKIMDVPPESMIWSKYLDPYNPYSRGIGAGFSLGDEIETDEYAAKVMKTALYNNAVPSMLIGIEGAGKEALVKAKAEWDQKHRGPLNSNQVHFHPGKITVEQLQQSFADMQLIELRKFERESFNSIFGVPPEIMGLMENSNKATAAAAETLFAREVLVPRLEFDRAEKQRQVVDLFDDTLVLDYVNPVPADNDFSLEVFKGNPGAFTVGQWRKLAGVGDDDMPDNDVYLVPYSVVGKKELYSDQPPPAAPARPAPSAPPAGEPIKALPPRATKSAKNAQLAVDALKPDRLKTEVVPIFQNRIQSWGDESMEDIGLKPSFNILNPAVKVHIEELSSERIGDIDDTTRESLKAALSEGVQAGEGIDELSARVEGVFEAADAARAENIARTEVGRSSNFATLESYRQSGVVDKKQWIATKDGRTRETHDALDGQVRGLDEDFEVDGQSADHPGDFGDPAEDCNCRCAVTAVIDEPKSVDVLTAAWKAYDAKLVPWENQAKDAFRRGFAKQKADVLAALRGS